METTKQEQSKVDDTLELTVRNKMQKKNQPICIQQMEGPKDYIYISAIQTDKLAALLIVRGQMSNS